MPTMPHNTKRRRIGLLLLLCGSLFFVLFGGSIACSRPLGMLDFRALYYATSALLHHQDPYNQTLLHAYYQTSGGIQTDDPPWLIHTLTLVNYLPTTFSLVAPFALFRWETARGIWMVLTAACFLVGCLMTWQLTRDKMPLLGGGLIGFLLGNSVTILGGGNAAGLVIGLCALAVWCLIENRLPFLAVLCLAAGLALKPHDAGFLWLYFLLAGSTFRRRAWQSLVIISVLTVLSAFWVSDAAPQWLPELRSVMATYDNPGGANYPGIHGVPGSAFRAYDLPTSAGMVCDLRTIVAVFGDDPRFYTPVTWLICAPLFAAWAFVTLRLPASRRNALFALAAIVPLSLLPVYHRTTDTKLLLLVLPACALLRAEEDRLRWPAALLTALGILITGDIPLTLIGMAVGPVDWAHATLGHRIALAITTRPVPLVLLALGVFYLFIYIQQLRSQPSAVDAEGLEGNLGQA